MGPGTPPGGFGPGNQGNDPTASYGGGFQPAYYGGQSPGGQPQGGQPFGGGQQTGQPTGQPGGPAAPKAKGRYGWGPLGAGVAVLAVIGVVATILAITKKDSGQGGLAGGSGNPGVSGMPVPGGGGGGASNLPVPGGGSSGDTQTVDARNHGIAYDVPKNWKIANPSDQINVVGKDGKTTLAIADDTAAYGAQPCPGGQFEETKASTGISSSNGQPDPRKAAVHAVGTWADGFYRAKNNTNPKVVVDKGKQISVNNGKNKAWVATGQVTPPPGPGVGNCPQPKSAVVKVVAIEGDKNGSVLLVLQAAEGVDGSVSPDELDKIGQSLKPSS